MNHDLIAEIERASRKYIRSNGKLTIKRGRRILGETFDFGFGLSFGNGPFFEYPVINDKAMRVEISASGVWPSSEPIEKIIDKLEKRMGHPYSPLTVILETREVRQRRIAIKGDAVVTEIGSHGTEWTMYNPSITER